MTSSTILTTTTMSDSHTIAARVDAVLDDTIRVAQSKWTTVDADLVDVFDEIRSLVLGGGKRLRPQFCYWGWVAAGGSSESATPHTLGAAIELLHVCALFHDDVIDDAASRRGKQTTHVRKAAEHSSLGFAGEPRRFGEGVAILIGDITYVMSDMLTDSLSSAARLLWHELRMEMNIGQYLDTLGSARRERSIEKTERVCRYKSAKYTIERPLHIGAVSANESRGNELLPMLSEYGLPLGDAFQMRDDILGAFGNSEVTGKPVGGDFREGKPTPLLARAYAAASETQKKVLDTVGSPALDDAGVQRIQSVVIDTGALAEMEQHIAMLHHQAITALDASRLAGESYRELLQLADVVTQRQV